MKGTGSSPTGNGCFMGTIMTGYGRSKIDTIPSISFTGSRLWEVRYGPKLLMDACAGFHWGKYVQQDDVAARDAFKCYKDRVDEWHRWIQEQIQKHNYCSERLCETQLMFLIPYYLLPAQSQPWIEVTITATNFPRDCPSRRVSCLS